MSQYDGPPDPGQYGNKSDQPGQSPGGGYQGADYGEQPPSDHSGNGYDQSAGAGGPAPVYGQQPGPGGPYGAQLVMAPGGTHVDPDTGVVIPNGTEVASTGRRIGAYFLAFVLGVVTLGIGYVIWGLIEWSNGRTPVQRVLGIRCYKNNEFRVFGWGDMFLREFIYFACSIIGIIQIVNFIIFLTNGKRQGLHDMASNCIVLHDPNKVLG